MRRINVSIPFFQGAKEFLKIEPPNKKQNKLKIRFPEFFQFGLHVVHLISLQINPSELALDRKKKK